MKTSFLGDARLAVALAHAEPRCVVELTGRGGKRVRVGRSCRAGCTVSPCAVRQALVEALAGASSEVAGSLDLAGGSVRARVLDEPGSLEHVGLGAYRCEVDGGRISFGLLLPLSAVEACVRAAIDDVRSGYRDLEGPLEGCAVRAEYDAELGTTVVVLESAEAGDPGGAFEQLAVHLCAACRVEELLSNDGCGGHTGRASI